MTLRRLAWILVVGGVVIWLSGLFTPRSTVNCWTKDVDITTGRIRSQYFFLYMPVWKKIEDHEITKVLEPSDLAGKTPHWRRVVTFSPTSPNYSPQYSFGNAIRHMHMLRDCWERAEFTPAAKRESAKRLLQMWQTSGRCTSEDYDYLDAMRELSSRRRPVDVNDLPK